jgi:antitoxin (DNA-binding transcriptional repressor) of toxin-antitoxin stability system
MTYSVQDARERLDEILERVRSGESVVISEDGQEIVEIRAVTRPASAEDKLRRLEEEGILSTAPENRPSLEEILRELKEEWRINPPKPGGLARFLESRG